MTFQEGRLYLSVEHACLSSSTKATCSKPAISSPSACPPPPAQISREVNVMRKIVHEIPYRAKEFHTPPREPCLESPHAVEVSRRMRNISPLRTPLSYSLRESRLRRARFASC